MKIQEHKKAILLRNEGLTYRKIKNLLGVSKGTLSAWLKFIPYTPTTETRKRRKLASIRNAQVLHRRKLERVAKIKMDAKKDINSIPLETFKLLGIIAYWCEGSKTKDSIVKFTNSDPQMIRFMVRWFQLVCKVPMDKIRIHLGLHSNIDSNKAREFWSSVTGIPLKLFYRTSIKASRSGGERITKLPSGIASIVVCDTQLFYRISGWIDALSNSVCGSL